MVTVAERPASPREHGALAALTARWVLIAVCLVVGFWTSTLRTLPDAQSTGLVGYLMLMVLLGVPMAIGITRRRHGELPIHDREVDYIVGILAMLVSLGISYWLVPRYREEFTLLRLDLLAAVAFLFGACVLLFGTRATCRYWPGWLAYLLFVPLTYRTMVVALGGSWFAAGAVGIFLVAVGTGIAVARTWRRGVAAAALTFVLGLGLLLAMHTARPDARGAYIQLLPAVIVAAAVCLSYLAVVAKRGTDPGSGIRSPRRPTVKSIGVAAAILVVATVLQAFTPLPPPTAVHVDPGPPDGEAWLRVPSGWTQTEIEKIDWAPKFFGSDATLTRQMLQADEVNPAWDTKNRVRSVVVDNLRTREPSTLAVYPGETLYSTLGSRRSETIDVDLGHDVIGRLYTVVDEELFLTWTKLQFIWQRGDMTQLVNLLSVDNHDPGANFPQLSPEMGSIAGQSLNVLLRGNAIQVDQNPRFKDVNLLSSLGHALVEKQWEAAS
ncbi:DUF2339 domain-containing protein [Rhodococcus spelaei]|uniref:DUF2339 domain-containing protein n=1 Tax=Rhodococcus spelaei TaxID=2546320 RepID=A0A541BAH5_9NOCA|nr:DUF2339 domain-containing protein [Rhodococcus spelaei]TQF69228.1 DUF2339 domain-containing protein [Rhodococcus spelaei]